MTAAPLGFKRVVLGLHPNAPSRTANLAAEFASLFDLELLGLFIEDVGLRNFAAMPFAREISALGGGWRAIEPARAGRELDFAANDAERRFAAAARSLARRQFEIVRAAAGQALAAKLRSGDVVTIGAPATPAERAAEPLASLIDAAFRSAAAVMLAPTRPARSAGPVVAMATTPNDPSIAAAAAIAEAMGEKLIVVELTTPAGHAWLSTHRAGAPAADIDGLPPDLHGLGERLAVLSRGAAQDRLALAIAAARGVPTLSIDSREEKEEEEEGRSRRRRPRAADQSSVSR